ncbi:MAG: signal peptide peptidase SppA [Candidatus Margulisbacteria bacterium]|nr:signal peptide peptidase SppA [Candidatus Margulisiibacteriota bacterium]
MKKLLVAIILFSLSMASIPDYRSINKFNLGSPGSFEAGLGGFDNPALLSNYAQNDLIYYKGTDVTGLSFVWPNLSYNKLMYSSSQGNFTDHMLALSMGSRQFSLGYGNGWYDGLNYLNRINYQSYGLMWRFTPNISMGWTGKYSTVDNDQYMELAYRPFADDRVTAYLDMSRYNSIQTTSSIGIVYKPLPNMSLFAKIDNEGQYTLGFGYQLGNLLFWTSPAGWGLRNGEAPEIHKAGMLSQKKFVKIDLTSTIEYQPSVIFSQNQDLLSLLDNIHQTALDQGVYGIAVNLGSNDMSPAFTYEIYKELKLCKQNGKKIVIFIEDTEMFNYLIASLGDTIIIDPLATLTLSGFISGKTYLKGLLAKLGIGYEEWRFFKYKSAYETLTRENMSMADKEQEQAIVQGLYYYWKTEVAKNRNISGNILDQIIHEEVMLSAKTAKEYKLVDLAGRWTDVDDILKVIENKDADYMEPSSYWSANLPQPRNYWEDKPKIALIYAVGICDLDSGINAHDLSVQLKEYIKDDSIKAIVIRVDSPGGSAMAADMVAQEVKTCTENKPIIVSQGDVAASGGYWLSMYGKRIFTTPFTIAGSIGVIGGWAYNNGLKQKLGLSTDYVAEGKHADLGFGMWIPLLGSLPDRNLDKDEKLIIKKSILADYDTFVTKVAEGRNLNKKDVESIAQGRVWLGYKTVKLRLADETGDLIDALNYAKKMAKIPEQTLVELVEYPNRPFINFEQLLATHHSFVKTADVKIYEDFRYRLKHSGRTLVMLPFEYYPYKITDHFSGK